ncbi:hypothetical protein, partial [Azospirillum brasilense]|uniref:hypothetical protein n=1 Tax=Azospirillum brasilense TaxID=192 RepID=UPI001964E73A
MLAIVLMFSVIAAVITFGKDMIDFADKLQVLLGFKPDSLQIAAEDAKGRFSRELTRSAWKRMFWMRRYGLAVEDGLPTLAGCGKTNIFRPFSSAEA